MKHPTTQLAGLLATALGILSMQRQSTRTQLRYQMSGNLLFVLHYWMLGACRPSSFYIQFLPRDFV